MSRDRRRGSGFNSQQPRIYSKVILAQKRDEIQVLVCVRNDIFKLCPSVARFSCSMTRERFDHWSCVAPTFAFPQPYVGASCASWVAWIQVPCCPNSGVRVDARDPRVKVTPVDWLWKERVFYGYNLICGAVRLVNTFYRSLYRCSGKEFPLFKHVDFVKCDKPVYRVCPFYCHFQNLLNVLSDPLLLFI